MIVKTDPETREAIYGLAIVATCGAALALGISWLCGWL